MEVRYVGYTIHPTRRLIQHLREKATTHKGNWIRALCELDLQPIMEIIETGIGDWQKAERYWIAYYRFQGMSLTNGTDGGKGIIHIGTTKRRTKRKLLISTTSRRRHIRGS